MAQFYKEFFQPREGYKPVMTREEIESNPRKWLDFYPHETFVEILRTLFLTFERGDASLWIHGAYGTGKSFAALVIQKLFMDDDARVREYGETYRNCLPSDLLETLEKWRRQSVLVVYETGTDNVSTPQELLLGVERAVKKACEARGFKIPSLNGEERLVARIREQEERFFAKRDEIQSQLVHLTPDVKTAAEFEKRCRQDGGKFANGLLAEAEKVFEYDCVYLLQSAEDVLDWIDEIRRANGISKIVFLWDEFTSYIDHAKGDLKTFEKLAESKAQQCGFHFVPITHKSIEAFLVAGSESAKKAKDRYRLMALQIPANQVYKLGAHAFRRLNEREWNLERDRLWSNVSPVVTTYMAKYLKGGEQVSENDFKEILPLHPMSAFLLRHMAEKVGSNARSFFDYLCVTSGESEFQKFLAEGGPAVANHQYLTVDYLWRYFIERPDLGTDNAVQEIAMEFASKKSAAQLATGSPQERVFKAALLYSLMEKKSGNNVPELLSPTEENIQWAFMGDGAIADVRGILRQLEEKHCFSLIDGRVMPLIAGPKVDPSKFRNNFTELVAAPAEAELQKSVNMIGDALRYDVQAHHGVTFKASDVRKRTEYGECENGSSLRQGNKILVNFLLARDAEEKIAIPEKAKQMARQFAGLRIVFAYFNDVSFCETNAELWESYISLKAQADAATDQGMRAAYDKRARDIFDKWKSQLVAGNANISLVVPAENTGDEPILEAPLAWASFRAKLTEAKNRWFYNSPDDYSLNNVTALRPVPTGLKGWAKSGLTGVGQGAPSSLVQGLKTRKGVSFDDAWFETNPESSLTKVRDFLAKKRQNTIGAGNSCSLRLAFLELRRAPYGLEKNAFSAFVLGFALRPWLEKNLQWTDGRISQPLDVETLAEIIEKAVLSDGEKVKDEKLICRLSKEEKSFTTKVSQIFGLSGDSSSTPESVLAFLGEKIRTLTGNVPLWTLPPYVQSLGTETAEADIREVIGKLCDVVQMSSKNKDATKTEKIKAIGAILQKEGLDAKIKGYLTPATFESAFEHYLSAKAPDLKAAAERAHDVGHAYRKSVLDSFAMDASWLWSEGDVSGVLQNVKNQYRFILSVQGLFAVNSWMDFATAQRRMATLLTTDNKISLEILAGAHPFVAELAALVKDAKIQGAALEKMCDLVANNVQAVRDLFRDPKRTAALAILRKNLGDVAPNLSDDVWNAILDERRDGAELGEQDYRKVIVNDLKARLEASERSKLLAAWRERTDSATPNEWSAAHRRPADALFEVAGIANQVLGVMRRLDTASGEDIKSALAALKSAKLAATEARTDELFLTRCLPKRYQEMGVSASELAAWFAERLGDDPNGWRFSAAWEDCVQAFVQKSYETSIRPHVETRIQEMSADAAKAALLRLAQTHPEIGLDLMK